jgi:hypothetical protein
MMLNDNLDTLRFPEVHRKNWSVLPLGEHLFENIENHINEGLRIVNNRNSRVIKGRVQEITNAKPNFLAVGNAGFTGYWIFGFPDRNIYILESVYPNNATYVLGQNWEIISQMSKAEILRNDLHVARIVHRNTWNDEIRRLLR